MKAIFCTECGDFVALRFPWRACECGLSGGQYKGDGDTATVSGPCRVYGVDNRLFSIGRADAFLYPEENGKIERLQRARP